MKRRAKMIVLFVLAGAILNVAVAWGCCWFIIEPSKSREIGFPSEADAWLRSIGWDPINYDTISPADLGDDGDRRVEKKIWTGNIVFNDRSADPDGSLWQSQLASFGHDVRDVFWLPVLANSPLPAIATMYRAGFPCFALEGEISCSSFGHDEFWSAVVNQKCEWRSTALVHTREVVKGSLGDKAIPLRPIWPGFAINTVFYAAILWIPFAMTGVVRRRIRAHRGRCTACGYDLRGRGTDQKLCPECGASACKPS